jgi:hypothetical protein
MKLSDLSTPTNIGVLIVLTITLVCQAGFNQRLLDLTEASDVPLIFAEFDSLNEAPPSSHNVFYTVKNVGNTPALNLRSKCEVNREKSNAIEKELIDTGVVADVFPTEVEPLPARREFRIRKGEDTLYFHVRVDFKDMLDRKYWYRATYWILFKPDTSQATRPYRAGMEWSDFKTVGKK